MKSTSFVRVLYAYYSYVYRTDLLYFTNSNKVVINKGANGLKLKYVARF